MALLALLLACPTEPRDDDAAYYSSVCKAAGMTLLEGTRTCVGPDGSYINLQPRRR
jgi:hypothetical protein